MLLKTFEYGDPDAAPLVAVHGVGVSHVSYARVAEERWGRRFRVIAVDLRGHGDSGGEAPWTHRTHLADLIETVDALGLESPMWVGHSFGARLVLDLIASRPERVSRAVLLDPVIQVPSEVVERRAAEELVAGEWDSLRAYAESRGFVPGTVDLEAYAATFLPHFEDLPDGRVRRRTSQAAVVCIFSEFAAPAPDPATVTVPTLMIYAPEAGLVTPEQHAAYAPHLAGIVTVPGGHSVFWTAFEETASAVEDFLAQAAPAY